LQALTRAVRSFPTTRSPEELAMRLRTLILAGVYFMMEDLFRR
jgi:hypothetical protein